MSDQERMAKFQQFIRRYEINTTFASKLRGLDGYEIVFICDDSGSMNTELSDVSGPNNQSPTRCPTPIVKILRKILKDKRNQIRERKLLILLATDGEPTDDMGKPRIDELRQCLLRERIPTERIPVTIIACTDDKNSMSYLNDWDKVIPNLDVVDDYRSEKEEILACQGKSFPFSYGDYVVKILMGGIDSWFDDLDEKKVSTDEYGRSEPRITTNNNF
ncbi:unnamed protein product [Rotaria sp. Silwood1]|nr:unnamed protein product [Rotaria sp. Silwood1]